MARTSRPTAVALGSYVCFLVQMKGWGYQRFPMVAVLTLAALVAFSSTLVRLWGLRGFRYGRAFLYGLSLLGIAAILSNGPLRAIVWRQDSDAVRTEKISSYLSQWRGEFAYAVSTSLNPAIPAVYGGGLKWASRYPALWTLPAVVRHLIGDPRRVEIEQSLLADMASDLAIHRPRVVLVSVRDIQALPYNYDILGFAMKNADFARIWTELRYHELNAPEPIADAFRVFVREQP